MLTDFRFEDYAEWRSSSERLRGRTLLSAAEKQELVKWDTLIEMWLSGMEQLTDTTRGSDTEIWRFIEELDFAGVNAENLVGSAPGVESVFERPTEEALATPTFDVKAERAWCLANIREGMALYKTVRTLPSDEHPTGTVIPFDMLDESNPRSKYQNLAYGCLIDDLEKRSGVTPYEEARTKPRQVGSTEFWKQLAAYLMQLIPGYKVCFQFPVQDDALKHGEGILSELDRMHELWPHLFWKVTTRRISKGVVELANGSELQLRHGGGSGVFKVGQNFNLFVASEAGKYERHNPDAWKQINTFIIPAVHPGPFNIRAWEGTNDELAYELNRIVKLSTLPHSSIRFKFFGWDIIDTYVGPPIESPEVDKYGRYADYELVDNERRPLSEKEYGEVRGLSAAQLGFRRQKIDGLGTLDLFHQEYPLTYEESQVSGTVKFFPTAILLRKFPTPKYKANFWSNTRTDGRVTPWKHLKIERDETVDGRWWIWHDPELTDYVMAADFSDGIPGGDYTSMGIFRVRDGVQVAGARFRGGARNEITICDEMVTLAARYGWSRVRVIGELDGPGKAVRSRWIDHNHPNNYHRMLGRKSYDEYTDSMWYTQSTNSATRAAALLNMRTALADGKMTIKDERWKIDAEDFIKHKSGKYAGAEAISRITQEKVRDDMVMMSGLAWEGIRTHDKYGRTARLPAAAERVLNLSPQTEVESLRFSDLANGLIGRLLDGHS